MATLQDRFNINSQLEHLQAKYVGTGHADLQRFEWAGEWRTPKPCLTSNPPTTSKFRSRICGLLRLSLLDDAEDPWCVCCAVNIARDSYASYVGHHPMLEYFAIAQNESIGRVRYEFLQKMLLPCGTLHLMHC